MHADYRIGASRRKRNDTRRITFLFNSPATQRGFYAVDDGEEAP